MNHGQLERIEDKVKACVLCLHVGRTEPPARPRKSLIKLSNNSVRPQGIDKRRRRERVKKGIHGCKLCEIAICNHIACWKEHLEAIPCI